MVNVINISQLNPTSYTELTEFLINMLNWAIGISAILTVIYLVIAGYKLIMSMGDDKKIAAATRSLIYSVVGMIIVFLAPSIIQFVLNNLLGE